MILTHNEILKEIAKKRVKIEPFDKKRVGPVSVDLTLDNKIRVFKHEKDIINIGEDSDYKEITEIVGLKKGYILKPGELVLGITKEKITLPEDICGWLQSRSRFARFGLMSHITAPFVCPGVSNYQVLEIFNASPRKIRIAEGLHICQLILEKCKGKAKYEGIFKSQEL